jgi:signal transduction histidine kinase/DNA-binding NarL/FixJ family response regulator
MRWHPFLSLKYRIAACIFALEAVMMFLVLGQTLDFSRENTRLQLAENEHVILDVFADLSQNALFTRDFGDLQQYAEKLTKDPHVLKVLVGDRNRRIVVSTDFSDLGKPVPTQFTDATERFWRTQVIGNLGMIGMEFSNRELIEASRRGISRGITIALIGMAVIAVAGIAFGFLLTRRLKTVSDAAARLASGDLSVRTGFAGRDEVSVVGRTFDRMAAQIQRDISMLEEKQRALVQARDELEVRVAERTLELQAASEAKSEFLATMSHEMRTPLNGVVGAAELLAAKELPPTERQLVDWLLASSRQLRSLIDNLLDLRKIEAGKMAIERAPFDLRVLMSRIAALFEPEAGRAKLRFTQSVAADVPQVLIGDDARIRQVLINLIANALRFTREGGIGVSAGVLAQSGADVTLRFEVRDTGIGIAPEDAARIFDKFAQANAGIHREYGGSGLGTTICKHLVELMGGTIGFDSQPGRGTTFWFTVPFGRQATELLRDAEAGLAGQQLPGATGLRVLVAEDNPINQQIIAMMLQAGGHHVTLVSDGDAVIEQFRTLRFHALVLDMHMPGRTGLDVAKAVRVLEAHGKMQRTPIIMLTAAASTDLKQSSIDAGVDLFLSKPVDPRALLLGVNQVFSGMRDTRVPAAAPARGNYVDQDLLRDMAQLAPDPGFIAGFTGKFTREARRLIDEIEAALARGDFGKSRELAHSLKGAAVMTGAVRLGNSAARLETLSSADAGVGAGMLQDLRATLDATSDELSRVV